MALLDKKTGVDLVKLLIFIVVTTLATGLLVVVIGNLTFQRSREFTAEFRDVTGLTKGDEVRVAGVKVGTVKGIEAVEDNLAEVTFSVAEGTRVTESTDATIRFRNLVGQRYIALTQDVGETTPMEAGDTIPVSRTSPALDLTVLFNGFKPLFEALSPDDINQLSFEIVQVFQGQGGTLESLLASTASVTQTLANRDEVIGSLLDNLDVVLQRVGDRDDELSALIVNFRDLVGGLADDREAILSSLEGISDLSVQTADLVQGIRRPFVEDVKQLRRTAGLIDRNKSELDRALQVLPIKLNKVGRTAINGSWFNFYLCDFALSVTAGDQDLIPRFELPSNSLGGQERCDLS